MFQLLGQMEMMIQVQTIPLLVCHYWDLFFFLSQFYCTEELSSYDAHAVRMGEQWGGSRYGMNQSLPSDYKSHRILHPAHGTAGSDVLAWLKSPVPRQARPWKLGPAWAITMACEGRGPGVRATPEPASSMAHSTVTKTLALWTHT